MLPIEDFHVTNVMVTGAFALYFFQCLHVFLRQNSKRLTILGDSKGSCCNFC